MTQPTFQIARTDDRAAELYRKFGAVIYSRCRRILRDPTAAEDATQEVFLRALKHLESAPSDAAARSVARRMRRIEPDGPGALVPAVGSVVMTWSGLAGCAAWRHGRRIGEGL